MTGWQGQPYSHRVSDDQAAGYALSRAPAWRRGRGLGPLLLLAGALADFSAHPAPGLHGHSLAISFALAGLIGGGLGALGTRSGAGPVHGTLTALVLASSAVLLWLQPGGIAVIGLFLGVFLLIGQVPRRLEIPVAVVGAAGVAIAAAYSPTDSSVSGFLGAIAVLGLFGMTFLARRLTEGNNQARDLLAELEHSRAAEARAAALAERQRLAREMHDVLAHSLSGLLLQLEGARMLAAANAADPRLPTAIERAHHLGASGLDEARRAIAMLRDEELPGPERLAELAAQFTEDRGVPCAFAVSGEARELASEARLAVYRVAQEALTNIIKHARPVQVEMSLAYEPDGTRLTVQDYSDRQGAAGGRGRPSGGPAHSAGYGLAGMRERAELLGGTLTAGRTDTGFRVELQVPA